MKILKCSICNENLLKATDNTYVCPCCNSVFDSTFNLKEFNVTPVDINSEEDVNVLIDKNPFCSDLYVRKMLESLGADKFEDLFQASAALINTDEFKLAYKFADENLKEKLNLLIDNAKVRIEIFIQDNELKLKELDKNKRALQKKKKNIYRIKTLKKVLSIISVLGCSVIIAMLSPIYGGILLVALLFLINFKKTPKIFSNKGDKLLYEMYSTQVTTLKHQLETINRYYLCEQKN